MRKWNDDEQLENAARAAGAERYWKAIEERGEADSRPGATMIRKALKPATAAIRAWAEEAADAGREGRGFRDLGVARLLASFDPAFLAFVTLREVLNATRRQDREPRASTVGMSIAAILHHCSELERVKAEHPEFVKRIDRSVAAATTQQFKWIVVKGYQKALGMHKVKWGQRERARAGLTVLELVSQATNLFTTAQVFRTVTQRATVVRLNEEAVQWLEKSHEACQFLRPLYLPTLDKPLAWSKPTRGGYRDLPAVLVKGSTRAYTRELAELDLSDVYGAVNALQETPWQINTGVLGVLMEAWERGLEVGLPPRDERPLPPKSWLPGTQPEDAVLKAWNDLARPVYEQRVKDRSKRLELLTKLDLAEEFAQHDRFYLPHQLDFRGRMYCMVPRLNPQEDDVSRGLLRFAEAVPLGEGGAFWLAVHGANLYGVKGSFEERVQWVRDHEEEITASATFPLRETFWRHADGGDACWQFLAFCYEWTGYALSGYSEQYGSRLPVSVDGSCNGLQNFSAMLRDEVGGAAVNLVPGEKPHDIYSKVAALVAAQVETDADYVPAAARWVGKVSRAICKRPTMTMPYGATQYGYTGQLQEAVRKERIVLSNSADPVRAREETFEACLYLAPVVYKALGAVVVKARQAMDWLQEAARLAASEGLPVCWSTPSGFWVEQRYTEAEGEHMDFTILGTRYRVVLQVMGSKISKKRQANGIAPNYVHSLDAAHLVATVNLAAANGAAGFAMVHDSYGCHAGNMWAMAQALRAAFVEQYTPDVLGKFAQEVEAQLPEAKRKKMPAPPEPGTLELAGVLESDYFFA